MRTMTPQELERNKNEAANLSRQYPDPYTPGAWYPATLTNGKRVDIRRTNGKGRSAGQRYLQIRLPVSVVVRTPEGEELSRRPGYSFYRMNLNTYSIEEM